MRKGREEQGRGKGGEREKDRERKKSIDYERLDSKIAISSLQAKNASVYLLTNFLKDMMT